MMIVTDVKFSGEEARVIAILAEHFDKSGGIIQLNKVDVGVDNETFIEMLYRFQRYEMVTRMTMGGEVWEICPNLLTVANQLSAPKPPHDYWKALETWFRSRWWSLPVLLAFVGLPLVVSYIQMAATVLRWFGVVGD